MYKKIIILTLLLVNFIHAATLTSEKHVYSTEEPITINFNGATGHYKNWIGIYQAGAANNGSNVLLWAFAGDKDSPKPSGKVTINQKHRLKTGRYEAKIYYNNSYLTEGSTTFIVKEDHQDSPKIALTKKTFTNNEKITLVFSGMNNGHKDWIAIYHAGADNNGNNVITWKWTGDTPSGKLTFNTLGEGKYEVRAYHNNSYKIEAKASFEVKIDSGATPKIALTEKRFTTDENITLVFSNMNNAHKDWIAIYRHETDNNWKNVIDWRWTGDTSSGKLTFGKLKEGEYDVRAYYNNSYKTVAENRFSVYKTEKDIVNEKKNALKTAHKACDNGDNSINYRVMCSNDLKHAYVFKTTIYLDNNKLRFQHNGFYYVTLETNTVKLIDEETTYLALLDSPLSTFGNMAYKFKGTSIIMTKAYNYKFSYVYYFYANGIKIKTFKYKDARKIDTKKIKVLENGKKLYLEQRYPNDKQEIWKDTYDISNPMKMVLIHRDIVKI